MKLTEFSSGGGCGCKIPKNILSQLLNTYQRNNPISKLLVGNVTSDDAAV